MGNLFSITEPKVPQDDYTLQLGLGMIKWDNNIVLPGMEKALNE